MSTEPRASNLSSMEKQRSPYVQKIEAERFREPIRNFDPSKSVASQMERCDFLMARLVVDAEALSQMLGLWPPKSASLIAAREHLEAKGIVPGSVYYGGFDYAESLKEPGR